MSIPAAPQITSYRNFVESVKLSRIDEYLERNTLRPGFRGLGNLELFAANRVLEQDYFQVIDAPSRIDYLLANRDVLLVHLEQYVAALDDTMESEPQDVVTVLRDALQSSADDVHTRFEQLRREILVLDGTHVLMDQHLRESMVEHDFDFTQADSYQVTEYPRANAWFYSPLLPIHATYFEKPTLELLSEYISKARELQASEHPLLGDPDFARVFRLVPGLRELNAALLDELTAAELMSPLLTDDRVTEV